jgi:hypothetical protein
MHLLFLPWNLDLDARMPTPSSEWNNRGLLNALKIRYDFIR